MIFLLVLCIFFIVFGIVRLKWNPVVVLFIASLFVAQIFKLSAAETIEVITKGFSKTLGSIGLIIAFGTIIGVFLEKMGLGEALIVHLLDGKKKSQKKTALITNLAGFIIAIPVFCDSGFIVLSSLIKNIANRYRLNKTVLIVALSTGLYAAHVFVPPTPGPLAAISLIEANFIQVMLGGLLIGLITSLTGYWYAVNQKDKSEHQESIENVSTITPSLAGVGPILVPLFLIALGVLSLRFESNELAIMQLIQFIGNPTIALFIGVLWIIWLARGEDTQQRLDWVETAFQKAGPVLLVTGVGGAFGAVIGQGLEVNSELFSGFSPLMGLLLIFGVSAFFKSLQGSSTVAILTTSSLAVSLLPSLGLDTELSKTFVVLSIGAGAMTFSHVNDSYFWVVSKFGDLNTSNALKAHSLATLLQGVVAFCVILLGFLLLG